MKKKILGFLVLLCLVAMAASCERDKYCRCTTVEAEPQDMIINVDYSMNCHAITEVGIERIVDQVLQRDMVQVKCKRATSDENIHLQ